MGPVARTVVAVFTLAAPAPGPRPALSLAAIDDEALHGCGKTALRKALRGRLDDGKRFTLAAEQADAGLVLEVTQCALYEARRRVLTTGGRPTGMPTESGGSAVGSEGSTGIETQSTPIVRLKARLACEGRSVEVSSDAKDRNLDQAAQSLRRAIDAVLAERGGWLLGRTGPR